MLARMKKRSAIARIVIIGVMNFDGPVKGSTKVIIRKRVPPISPMKVTCVSDDFSSFCRGCLMWKHGK